MSFAASNASSGYSSEGDHSETYLPAPPEIPIPTEARKSVLPLEDLSTLITPPGEEPQHRFKIEYMPIARPVDTYGGRRLEDIERQTAEVQARRQVRNLHEEWGETWRSYICASMPHLTYLSWVSNIRAC